MTQDEIQMVQGDWRAVVPLGDLAATLFYQRLFELDPTLRSLFKADLTDQKKKLLQILGVAVAALDKLSTIVPAVEALGKRHVAYGVKPEQYATVGAALLWTLHQGLGAGFDAAHEAAWTTVYGILSETMKAGAAQP